MSTATDVIEDIDTWIEDQGEFEVPCERGEFCTDPGAPAEYLIVMASHDPCGVLRRKFCASDAAVARELRWLNHVTCGTDRIPILFITRL